MKTGFKYYLRIVASLFFIIIILDGCNKNKDSRQVQNENLPAKPLPLNFNCTGYIETYFQEDGVNYLIIDTVEWFEGEAAKKVLNEDKKLHGITDSEHANGFYIRNKAKDSLAVKISDSAQVIMQTFSYSVSGNYNFNEKIDVNKFLSLLKAKEWKRFKHKLFNFEIVNDKVKSINEKYIP